jgi:hypothetical protein
MLLGPSPELVRDLVGVDATCEPDPATVHEDCVAGLDEAPHHVGCTGVLFELLLGCSELRTKIFHLSSSGYRLLETVLLVKSSFCDLCLGPSALGARLQQVGALAVALYKQNKPQCQKTSMRYLLEM